MICVQTWEDWSGLQDFGFLKICQQISFRCLNKRLKYCLGPLQSNLFNTYGHQREGTKCPLYRGVRIIEVGNGWFLLFLEESQTNCSYIERCPYCRGVRKERLDCIKHCKSQCGKMRTRICRFYPHLHVNKPIIKMSQMRINSKHFIFIMVIILDRKYNSPRKGQSSPTQSKNIGTLIVHELFWMLQCNFNASV